MRMHLSVLHSARLLPRRPSGVVAVSSLRGARCGSLLSFSSRSSSARSPRSLALQQGTVGVQRVQVEQQLVLGSRRVPALLAHVQLVASLLVGVLQRDAVDLLHVGLQRAALGEGLVAEGALVRTHTWRILKRQWGPSPAVSV